MNQKLFSIKLLLASCLSLCLFKANSQAPTFANTYPRVEIRYSTPVTNEIYQNNMKILVKAAVTGTAYYLVYNSQPSPEPTGAQIVDIVNGTVGDPGTLKTKGSINMTTANTEYSRDITNFAFNSTGYYTYIVIKNTSGTSDVFDFRTRYRLKAKKLPQYYYLEYLPTNYNPASGSYPLMIFLHGNGERGGDIASLYEVLKNGPPRETNTNGKDYPMIILSPQSNPNPWNVDSLDHFLDQVLIRYPRVDVNKIYFTGLSMGGYGTWKYAQAHAPRLAAIVPISGGGTQSTACNLKDMPIWAFHDDPDNVVSASNTKNMETWIKACAGYTGKMNVTFITNYDDDTCKIEARHGIWGTAYGNTPSPSSVSCVRTVVERHSTVPDGITIYNWLLLHSRNSNNPPVASAGNDQSINLPSNSVNLSGLGTDTDGTITGYAWSKLSGPSSGTITSPTSQNTSVTGLVQGTYVFRLTVTDNGTAQGTDDVTVTVLPAAQDSWLEFTTNCVSGKRVELYADSQQSNSVQKEIGEGQNIYLQFYLKQISGVAATWSNMQIGMTVSFQNKYVSLLSSYLKETNADGWRRVEIPVADFLHDAAKWQTGGVSNIGFKIVSNFGTGTIVFGIDEIQFTGSATPYVWYGDAYTTSGDVASVYTLDATSFRISNRYPTGGVADGVSESGPWLKMNSAHGFSGKRIELYRSDSLSNSEQVEIGEQENTLLEFYLKEITGTPTWSNFQIGMTVSFQNKYVNLLSTYFKETTPDGWKRVEIPISAFGHDASRWQSGGVSNIGFKIVSNFASTNIVFGIDEVRFTGGPSPFVWYGDDYLVSGEDESVYTLDGLEFFISERPATGGAPYSGSGGMSMMAAPQENQTAVEPTQHYKVAMYDGHGQYLDWFNIQAKESELANFNFRPYVPQKGTYIFRIMNNQGKVISERILYKE